MYLNYIILSLMYVATRTNHSLMFCLVPLSRKLLFPKKLSPFWGFFQSHQRTNQYCNIQTNHILVVNDSPRTIFQSSLYVVSIDRFPFENNKKFLVPQSKMLGESESHQKCKISDEILKIEKPYRFSY